MLLLFVPLSSIAQHTPLSGRVTDVKNRPLAGASVTIKDSYDGASTDSLGRFSFSTSESGNRTIVISSVGYKSWEQAVSLNGSKQMLNVQLREELNELKAVVISAGSFEASDAKRVTVLKPLDILTTASANADIAAALRTLPGTQQVGESAELFVRGGAGYETRQFIDGTAVANPFYAAAPDIASRGRFSPQLFKGTVFSTGGYSALYGQALSAAVILESIDLPERSSAGLSLSPLFAGGQFQHLAKDNRSSYGATYGYTNLSLYFGMVPQKPDYFRVPQLHNADVNFRVKVGKTGMLKFYSVYGWQKLGLRNPNLDSASLKDAFGLINNNWYNNLSYRQRLGNRWKMNLGLGLSGNDDNMQSQVQDANNAPASGSLPWYIDARNYTLRNRSMLAQVRAVFEYKLAGLSALRMGGEYWYSRDSSRYNKFGKTLTDHFSAAFAEGDIYITNKLAAKAGARLEHSALMNVANLAPRFSMAYKTARFAQASLAYGQFYQKPLNQFLLFNDALGYMKATHYIANYQVVKPACTLRVEAFYKKYSNLVSTLPDTANNGNGFAQGVEVFWRDKKTFKNVDYWITYSFLDTKRDYLNYPFQLTPTFAARHTANLVVKRYFSKLNTQVNLNYQFATGRPYYDIRYDATAGKHLLADQGTTIPYNNLSFSLNYLPKVGKTFTVFVLSITNVLGSKQVFGYNYSYNGLVKAPVTPPAPRFIFLGMFMSWGTDRRQDAINNNL